MLDKTYDSAEIEPRIYADWEQSGAFKAGAGAAPGAETYTIVIPPPNVTGSLHMGHALNNTLQDILIRFERMRGKDVLWQPGTDHAGIATQMVVERQLMEAQLPGRRDMGRQAFVDKVWEWKAESGGVISQQLRRLGASCDWSRERFTMDEGLSEAVLEVFVSLYRKGLIYKDKRLVNWDPKLMTAISDLEVEQVEINGHLWHLRYPLADGLTYEFPVEVDEDGNTLRTETRDYIVVATTRPETMLGDTAIAVHPDDPRYAQLIGQHAILPLVGRRIVIVGDDYADPEAGSGAVKITPAHDFNDFDVGKRHDLAQINVMTIEADMTLAGNEAFLDGLKSSADLDEVLALEGVPREVAREKIVEMMQARGLLERIEDHPHMVPHGDRGGVPIEPFLTDQWYVNAEELAKPAIASVREGRTKFVPQNWEKTYFEWMENIQPWCISRQLWWGHQIPAWYGPDGHCFVEMSEAEAQTAATAHYGEQVALTRAEDVLDTWLSSALWPFSTLGWPEQTDALEKYYPTSVLVTGFDIIFFWVARMMMSGLEFMKTEPFHTVYVHALVRDEHGAKMSKSKGNVIDPLDLIDEFGADALRFTLTAMAAQGRDIKLAASRVAGYRNFATKLWNASRFTEMNECRAPANFDPAGVAQPINRWIASELSATIAEMETALIEYRFNDAASAIYRFTWNLFCDWYLELAKPLLQSDDQAGKVETRNMVAWVRDTICKALHPIMPFITEELWQRLESDRPGALCAQAWPSFDFNDAAAVEEMRWVIETVTAIRSARAEMNVPPAAKLPVLLVGADATIAARLAQNETALMRLARLESIVLADAVDPRSLQVLVGETTLCLKLGDVIDIEAERGRLTKDLQKTAAEIAKLSAKLSNEKFVSRAPAEVVEGERAKLAEGEAKQSHLNEAIARLELLAGDG